MSKTEFLKIIKHIQEFRDRNIALLLYEPDREFMLKDLTLLYTHLKIFMTQHELIDYQLKMLDEILEKDPKEARAILNHALQILKENPPL